ncbi:glycosyltransferase [Thioalkalivibrio paradoxus]|uniref:Glycosyl transferase family 1 n=1 Tax=Thioalkalivibrio paradoxus ARh 1 TaxID=713585 RepID=W0DMP0_9GAMM|nr:glycosyltransferase [Thioalkalivibrio paradoxus]AHE98537.1 glycosyl transferase family 1 [Thioalkalivibrio paradoxus ARh 1]
MESATPRRNRVLLVVHLAATFGGAERTTLNVLNGLGRADFTEVVVLAPRGMHAHWSKAADRIIDADPLEMAGWFRSPRRLRHDANRLAVVIRTIGADVVLGMMHYMAAVAEQAVRRHRLPARVIGSFRGPVFEHLRAYEPNLPRRWWIRWQLRRSARGMFSITVPGSGTRDELLRHGVGRPSQLQVIPNGIDRHRSERAGQGPLELPAGVVPGQFVLALGRLSAEKRFEDLVSAYALSNVPWPLVVVGEGPERNSLARQASALGIADRVHFAGATNTPERWMSRAGVFIHTCRYEGFGYTLLEAAALGIPVIATDCPFGPREVLGEAGLLVAPDDPHALATAICQLVEDPPRRAHMSRASRDRADCFSLTRSQAAHATLLRAALDDAPPSGDRARP